MCMWVCVSITNDGAHLRRMKIYVCGREWMGYERKWTQSKEKTEQIKAINGGGDVCVLDEINPASTIYCISYRTTESESKCKSIKWFVSASNRNVDRIEVCGRKHFNYLLTRIRNVSVRVSECVCVHYTQVFIKVGSSCMNNNCGKTPEWKKASHTIWMCRRENNRNKTKSISDSSNLTYTL